ncbi:MAG: hypothetical protein OXG19_07825 [Chloroflexi bacterium]|nr:hypothetical protein [Chloroflexota bacterium]
MRALLAAAALLVAGSTTAACGSDAPPTEQSAPSPPQTLTVDEGKAFGVPGLSIYSVGGDLQLERNGDLRKLVVAPSLNVSYLSPRISPDGQAVAYVRLAIFSGSEGVTVLSDIRVAGLDDGGRVVVTPRGEGSFVWTPQWSPDQESLVYAHQLNQPDDAGRAFQVNAERVNLTTGESEILVTNARDPALSPDGRLLVFVDDPALAHKLSVLNLETGERTPLLTLSDGLAVFRLPQFSPDGAWIAVAASGEGRVVSSQPKSAVHSRSNGVQDVWLIRPDGSGLHRLTGVQEDQPDFAWSQDGRHILLRGTFGSYLAEVSTRRTQTILVPGELHGTHDWRGSLPADPAEAP